MIIRAGRIPASYALERTLPGATRSEPEVNHLEALKILLAAGSPVGVFAATALRDARTVRALIRGEPQQTERNPDGKYRLYRIGDAVSSRNIHAAVYDALRLCKDF